MVIDGHLPCRAIREIIEAGIIFFREPFLANVEQNSVAKFFTELSHLLGILEETLR